jgi:hypothetical protein
MSKVHSHYENLKVPRDASQDEIRTAYRSLSQKNHPDRNPGKDDAASIMSMLNIAYETLSDPRKRKEHDEWIARMERSGRGGRREAVWTPVHPAGPARQGAAFSFDEVASEAAAGMPRRERVKRHLRRYGLTYVGAALLTAFASMFGLQSLESVPSLQSGLTEKFANLAPKATTYVRPPAAPNGKPWPQRSDYVEGFPVLHADGLSEVIVDNSKNDVDMFAKLVSLDGSRTVIVRNFLVMAHTSFVVHNLSMGSYDLRYRNLTTGDLQRSQLFEVEDVKTAGGMQHSTVKMPLYASQNGNMQTFALSESEF